MEQIVTQVNARKLYIYNFCMSSAITFQPRPEQWVNRSETLYALVTPDSYVGLTWEQHLTPQ